MVDARDPRSPVGIGSLEVPGFVSDMVIGMDHMGTGDARIVFLVQYPSLILAVDVTDPSNPVQRSSFDLAAGFPGATFLEMVVGWDHVAVVSSDKGVHVLDVSDPDQLRAVGYFEVGGIRAVGIEPLPTPAYVYVAAVAAGGTDLVDLNIVDRAKPTLVRRVQVPGYPSKGYMTVGTFYLVQTEYHEVGTGSDTGLWGVSTAEWSHPHLVSYCALDGDALLGLVDIAGGTVSETSCAFVALGNKSLQVVTLPEGGLAVYCRSTGR